MFRGCLLICVFYCAISSIHYAIAAQINFGIISCCYIISVPINTFAGLFWFDEKLNMKVCLGIVVTLCGIVWISISNGSNLQFDSLVDEETRGQNQFLSIVFALCVGLGNSSQTIISKFMMRNAKFHVMSMTADFGLIFFLIAFSVSLFNLVSGSPSLNFQNFILALFVGSLGMTCWLVGQNACINGVVGPAVSIMYTACIFTTILQVTFLGIVPSINQICAGFVAFCGILIIIFGK